MKAIIFLYPNPLSSAYYTLSYSYFAFSLMVFLETGYIGSMTLPGQHLKDGEKMTKGRRASPGDSFHGEGWAASPGASPP